jgi:hypothetical protein
MRLLAQQLAQALRPQRSRGVLLGAGALAALTVSACSGDDDSADPATLLARALDCGSYEQTPCDILDAACREQIAAITACQWGGPGTPVVLPDVLTLSQDDYRAMLTADASASTSADPQAGAAALGADHVLSLLGLIQAGDLSADAGVDRQVDGVLAYYAFDTKTITIIARDDPNDPALSADEALISADSTLMHELIHAQQDAAHDLNAFVSRFPGTADGTAAVQSLYEGEAEFQELLYQIGLERASVTPASLANGLGIIRTQWENGVVQDPSALLESLLGFPYNYGPAWIDSLWMQGGSPAVQKRYEIPATNTLEVLSTAWSVKLGSPAVTPFPTANVFAPNGAAATEGSQYIPIADDRLGPWTVNIATRLLGDGAAARDLALGWRGDQLDVYALDAGGYGGRWRLSFDTAAHAEAFQTLLVANPNVHARSNANTVVFVVSDGSEPEEWLYGPFAR